MDIYFVQWLTFISIFAVVVASPGPDMIMIMRNSLSFSRRAGIFTAIGLGLSVGVHVTYTLLGIAAIISQSIFIFTTIKLLGALYLIYIGIQALSSKGISQKAFNDSLQNAKNKKYSQMSDIKALSSGFLTNILNPKATLFFLAVFTQLITPETPLFWEIITGVSATAMVILWFVGVSLFLTHKNIQNIFSKISKWIDKIAGVCLIALGIKIAVTTE